ncbi:NTP transferase domain-containing protein [Enterococcus rivorum]|uniref:Molybdenum cofactor cytidylyltransferase n=1 Tax=Enterococcus rivorum TaxID=762845 RepID=A0A1E5KTI9_9ENTE|nr:NTP transferase domain-containing protein [Enterococcus rivorum]MBP2097942.1 molybdenum cofactor cytidylyltransferase [Enterococcus rivorum]OEH81205.1 molybdenum cofactor cytidylyltransferase [Enterococcus rivorum]
MIDVSVIIMASGYSKRMGENKLFLKYKNKTFLEHTLTLVNKVDFFERILVISPENVKDIVLPENITVVLNSEPELGQSASVRLGTKVASGQGYLYLPIDQPLLNKEIIEQLLKVSTNENIVFPVHENGHPSSPVFFGKDFRSELLAVSGASGGREVRKNHPEVWKKVKIDEPERLLDIDTQEDFTFLKTFN